MNANDHKETFNKLFEPFYDIVLQSGGDGDGIILCKYFDYKDVADLFEKFLTNKNYMFKKVVHQDKTQVVFYDGEEAFIIAGHNSDYNEKLPKFQDILIIY